jgi:hypothetical protein
MNLLERENAGGRCMFSVQVDHPKEMYVESETPQEKQKYKGWFYDSKTRKFYRWDNSPGSDK